MIDKPFQHVEYLTFINEDMFPSPEPFGGTELEIALQNHFPPSLQCIWMNRFISTKLLISTCFYRLTLVLKIHLHQLIQPLQLTSDIFDLNPEREITLDEQFEQLEIPFEESDL